MERKRFFWLGAIEFAPIAIGGLFAAFTDSATTAAALAGGALLLTALICWLLRHRTPPTRIELSS